MEQIRDNQKRISSLAGSERCTEIYENCVARGEPSVENILPPLLSFYAPLNTPSLETVRISFMRIQSIIHPVRYLTSVSLSQPPPYHNPLPSSVAQLARKYADGSARLARLVIRLRGPPGLRLRPEVNGTAMEMGTKMDHQRASDVETPCNLISRPPRHSVKPWRKGGRLN